MKFQHLTAEGIHRTALSNITAARIKLLAVALLGPEWHTPKICLRIHDLATKQLNTSFVQRDYLSLARHS